jgi:hypothetical protein
MQHDCHRVNNPLEIGGSSVATMIHPSVSFIPRREEKEDLKAERIVTLKVS